MVRVNPNPDPNPLTPNLTHTPIVMLYATVYGCM